MTSWQRSECSVAFAYHGRPDAEAVVSVKHAFSYPEIASIVTGPFCPRDNESYAQMHSVIKLRETLCMRLQV